MSPSNDTSDKRGVTKVYKIVVLGEGGVGKSGLYLATDISLSIAIVFKCIFL